MTGIYSGQRGSIRQGFGMIRLESSSSDSPMGMGFSGKGVNPSYTGVDPNRNFSNLDWTSYTVKRTSVPDKKSLMLAKAVTHQSGMSVTCSGYTATRLATAIMI